MYASYYHYLGANVDYDDKMTTIDHLPITPRVVVPEFKPYGKTPRWSGLGITITEKLDGTNALVCVQDGRVYAGSRNRWLGTEDKRSDNYGFAQWCKLNEEGLLKLGEGYHYGEWWGRGIGRGYAMESRRFSLFNTRRWGEHNPNTPECCDVVPVLYEGQFTGLEIQGWANRLQVEGSVAAPGYMSPEGVVAYLHHLDAKFKVVLDKTGPSPIEHT